MLWTPEFLRAIISGVRSLTTLAYSISIYIAGVATPSHKARVALWEGCGYARSLVRHQSIFGDDIHSIIYP